MSYAHFQTIKKHLKSEFLWEDLEWRGGGLGAPPGK